ncbi:MAG: tetratricopeptide repeat protein [Saprospiraceae bacterium]|nr:tetratricopeptide repeat protein [Saprospiraceae bacterium]
MKASILYMFLLVSSAALLFGQSGNLSDEIDQARRLAEAGRHDEAEFLFNRILSNNPDNLPALLGAAYNYSWAKKFDQARLKFEAALSLDPAMPDALVGQGYNQAWAGNFSLAKIYFQKLLSDKPGNVEARKGLGYVHLWAGDGRTAETYFRDLTLQFPESVEFRIALAQAFLNLNEVKKARLALQSALQLDSTNQAAKDLLKSTFGVAAPLELDIWAGYSSTGGESQFALRTLQLSGQLNRKLRAYLKYDNSLTADLAALVRANQEAQALSLGAAYNWAPTLASRLEYGVRLLPDNVTQQLVSGEQVVFLNKGKLVKAGGFYGWSSKIEPEWLAYGGFRVPLARWYALEPYVFVSQAANAPSKEFRFLLNNQLRTLSGYELNLGLLYGKTGAVADAADVRTYGSYATAIFPFSQVVWGHLSFRWEHQTFSNLLILAGGFKLRLEK